MSDYFRLGWTRFAIDPAVLDWLAVAIPAAKSAVLNPAHAHWLRCEGTWFAGVNVLANDVAGAVAGSGPLRGLAVDFISDKLGLESVSWDAGQVSVIYPGYPRPKEGESEAAFGFRRDRDAAHVDGLHAIDPGKRRMLREPHAFVLGLPMSRVGAGASPMVVWEGSHGVMRAAFRGALAGIKPESWCDVDLTEAYISARKQVFETCRRVEVAAQPGEAYLVHRLALHGVAPWKDGAIAPPEGRMIAYFRPELSGSIRGWLDQD